MSPLVSVISRGRSSRWSAVEVFLEHVDRFVDVCVGIDHQQVVDHEAPFSSLREGD